MHHHHSPASSPPTSTNRTTMSPPGAPGTCLHHGVPMLLLFFTLLAMATTCHHPQPGEDTFSWDSLQLLQAMAPSPPHRCHQYQMPLFPQALLHTKHPRHAAAAVHSILQELLTLLSSTRTPRHWDAQVQHELLNHLDHYIHHLEKCMESKRTASKRHIPWNLLFSIKRYFMCIRNFLCSHRYSACAWDHIVLQVRDCFQHMDTLIQQMKNKATPLDLQQTSPHQTPVPSQRWQPQIGQKLQDPVRGLISTAPTSSRQETLPTGKLA